MLDVIVNFDRCIAVTETPLRYLDQRDHPLPIACHPFIDLPHDQAPQVKRQSSIPRSIVEAVGSWDDAARIARRNRTTSSLL